MTEVLVSLWILQLGILLPSAVVILRAYRRHQRIRHIRVISGTYLVLIVLNLWHIVIDGADPATPRMLLTMLAFIGGDITVLRLLMSVIGRHH